MQWETLLLTIGLLALGFAGIAIKILVKKDGEFSGTCSSNNPLLKNESGSCSICGARPQDQCQKEDTVPDPA
jgi:rRNA maturation endonuclease Nob1